MMTYDTNCRARHHTAAPPRRSQWRNRRVWMMDGAMQVRSKAAQAGNKQHADPGNKPLATDRSAKLVSRQDGTTFPEWEQIM